MRKIMFITIILVSGAFVNAQITPGVNQTQRNQKTKIRQGVKSGELTIKESRELYHQQKLIQLQKTMAKADGVITKKERARIKTNQAKAKSNIYKKKHNAVSR